MCDGRHSGWANAALLLRITVDQEKSHGEDSSPSFLGGTSFVAINRALPQWNLRPRSPSTPTARHRQADILHLPALMLAVGFGALNASTTTQPATAPTDRIDALLMMTAAGNLPSEQFTTIPSERASCGRNRLQPIEGS